MNAEGAEPYFSTWSQGGAELFAGAGTTVLMYHRLGSAPFRARSRALYVPGGLFRQQLRELRAAGVRATALDEMSTANDGGFCVTFDDGFRSVARRALPALTAAGVRATVFLVANLLGRTNRWDCPPSGQEPEGSLMDEGEVRDWLAAGQDIGSHALTHPRLTALSPARARAEIADSRKSLEDRFGRPVRHFCYPYGDWNAEVRDMVAEAGYGTACTTGFGRARAGADPFALPRVLARPRPLPPWAARLGRALRQVARK